MFIALDKLANQRIKNVVISVPEKSIGSSFKSTPLKKFGFFTDWKVQPYYNLCSSTGKESDKAKCHKRTKNSSTTNCEKKILHTILDGSEFSFTNGNQWILDV